jgi:Nif-specific regulatory protein
MGQVYLCEDILDGGRQVALKRLRRALHGDGGEEHLKQEFRAMVRLRHPNLARVYDYGLLDGEGEPFLTLEYLDGKDLAALEPAEIRPFLGELVAQLCRALDYIHARGVLHNDIKPQNIFLLPLPDTEEGPRFQVKLMDFGLVHFLNQDEPARRGGTLHYASPEALSGGRVDPRSDLYSLGVVLYRLATGSLPFTPRDPVALIRAHRETLPPSPRSLDPTLPAGLDRLILWLLEKNPEDRPRDAAALLRALNEALGTHYALETRETRDSYLTGAAMVGRDREMQALLSALASLNTPPAEQGDVPATRLILIGGESGVGKSRLLREFRTQIQTEGMLFLSGSCFETGGSVYQPFVDALRFLAPALRDSPQESEAAWRATLAPLFPDLSPGSSSDPEALSAREAKNRLFEAVERLLRQQSLKRPFVLALEDLHWADELTVELLRALRDRAPGAPYLVLGTYRDDDLDGRPIASLARPGTSGARQSVLRLQRLDAAEIGSLIQSMMSLQEDPTELAIILQRQTAGNPLFIEEILKALAEEDAVSRRDGEWDVDLAHLDRLEVPRSINETLTRRLTRLSDAQRQLVRVLSVFNRPVSRGLLARAGGWDGARLSAEIPPLLHRGILRRSHEAGEEKLGFAHSRARDLVYRSLGPERVRLHLTAGSLIEEQARTNPEEALEELAYHFIQAGAKPQALAYAEKAGDKCARLFAFTAALQFYRKALELLPRREARRRMTLFARLARLHGGASDFAEMHDFSERALRLARSLQDRREEGQILASMAHGHLLQGHLDQSVRGARAALALLEPLGDHLGIGRAKNFLGTAYARMGQLDEAVPYFTQALEHLEAAGDRWQVVTVKTNLGTVQSSLNRPEVSLELYREALEAWKQLDDRRGVAMTLVNMAQCLKDLGRLEEACERAEESAALYRSTPDRTTLAVALSSLAEIELARCRYDRAAHLAAESLEIRKETGDTSLQPLSLDLLGTVRRRLGDFPGAWEAHQEGLRLAREGSHDLQEGFLLLALARDALEEGKHREALLSGEKALVLARRLRNRRLQLGALEALLHASLGMGHVREASGRAREMDDLVGTSGSTEERLRTSAALGRCRLQEGLLDEASPHLEQALGWAQNLARRDQEADLRLAQSDWMEKSGRPERRVALLREAERLHREIASRLEDSSARRRYLASGSRQEVRDRLAALEGPREAAAEASPRRVPPVKMLATLYEITQIVSTLKDLTELLSRVLDLAIQIVGAERGLIFLREGENGELKVRVARNLDQETIRDAGEYSRRILEEAAEGKPIVTLDAGSDQRFERFDSVSLYNIRSLVCVPLRIRERILGTVYLDSRRGDVLFGEADLEFLEAFANQAAVAIENARLYDALRQENLYLKQTVQNRFGFRNIIGSSPALIAALERVEKVSDTALPVIIQGESGTGKELVARAIHFNSRRRDKRFLTENVAALPETLLESELFGHVRGAFTGADQDKPGLFELADGGTLFLDELGEMSMPLQSKLLRAVQEGEIRPVGSGTTRKVDVRIVAATNRDLKAMVAERKFREDLFYRLNVVTVTLPPLRQRKEDLPLLIDHFLERIAGEKGTRPLKLDPQVLSVLSRHRWPGNIRELENTLSRLALFAEGPSLTLADLARDPELLDRIADLPGGRKAPEPALSRSELRRALKAAAGNRSQAAALLGISRATLFRKLRELRVKE